MSETRTLIRRYYDAFNVGDLDAMCDCVAEDLRHDVNQGETRRGLDAFRAFGEHMARCYEERIEDLVVFGAGDRGAAEFIVLGKYIRTDEGLPEAKGQRYRLPAGAFFQVRHGLIARVTTYYNLTDWTAQVTGEGAS